MSSDPTPYRQQGEGPHPTLAGNMLDPNVNADGAMNAGPGVGGMEEGRVRQEGLEHIKKTTGSSEIPESSYPPTTPSTNPMSSTIPGASGGVSEVRGEPMVASGYQSGASMEGGRGYEGGSGLGRGEEGYRSDNVPLAGNTASSATDRDTMVGGSDPMRNTENATAGRPTDSDVTTGADPTESADPTTADTAKEHGAAGEGEEGESKKKDDKLSATRENKSAIPTAGGERLGEKHWGESKRVPDVPKTSEEEKVASKDGQPTDQTRDNTERNKGTAGNQNEGEHKEGMMDKIKGMMHK